MTKSEFLLKSSGGCAGEAAEEEEDRQQWWSPVGWQVFYFAFSWQLILLFWGAFVIFDHNFDGKVVPASSRPLPLQLQIRPGKCFENILSLFGSNKSWTRTFFSNLSYMIRDKIYPSSHFSWLFQEHKRLFCKKHVNCLKASSNVHF